MKEVLPQAHTFLVINVLYLRFAPTANFHKQWMLSHFNFPQKSKREGNLPDRISIFPILQSPLKYKPLSFGYAAQFFNTMNQTFKFLHCTLLFWLNKNTSLAH